MTSSRTPASQEAVPFTFARNQIMTTLTAPLPFEGNDNRKYYPSLNEVTRTHVTTEEAAYYLNRRPQTCRAWACLENGPLRPLRINGRLAWPVAELRKVLGVA